MPPLSYALAGAPRGANTAGAAPYAFIGATAAGGGGGGATACTAGTACPGTAPPARTSCCTSMRRLVSHARFCASSPTRRVGGQVAILLARPASCWSKVTTLACSDSTIAFGRGPPAGDGACVAAEAAAPVAPPPKRLSTLCCSVAILASNFASAASYLARTASLGADDDCAARVSRDAISLLRMFAKAPPGCAAPPCLAMVVAMGRTLLGSPPRATMRC